MFGLMSDECYEHIGGSTDTEALAALYMSYLTAGTGEGEGTQEWERDYTTQQMLEALQHTARTIIELQHTALGEKAGPNDLNVCVTDGRQLVAMRFRNHPTEQPPSLYYSTSAGVTLNRKFPDHPDGAHRPEASRGHPSRSYNEPSEHGKHVIVASEPTTYKGKDWELIEKNLAIMVESNGDFTIKNVF